MTAVFDNLRITTDFSLRLCALLRQSGVDVGSQQSIACLESLLLLENVNEEELRGIYRTTLINRKQDLFQLNAAYDLLMKDYLSPRAAVDGESRDPDREAVIVRRRHYAPSSASSANEEEDVRTEGYSVRAVDHRKDFRLVPRTQIPAFVAEMEKIAKRHATIARRKARRSKHSGAVDLRRSMRESVKFGGEIMQLRFKRKRPSRSRFVVVCDVSGSMEIYSVFLLNFLHVLHRHRKMKMESFVFSTFLQSLTKFFRSKNFPEMLRNVSAHFSGWSGGTKIGAAIETLNETYGTAVTPRTTVIIMSDGWDTGDTALLDREIARLRSRAKSIVWINPLKGDPAYEPLAVGMATARPYCDEFISGHNIDSFNDLAGLIDI
ncbi:MAG: hypothetical protein JWN43_2291 [Gammaproteobacteria bacterium]|nr:hypothetical protein [Gammaproteobacteria bacterium]